MLLAKGRVTIQELGDLLKVSGTTIRTYLTEMEQSKLLIRTHGGAILTTETLLPEDAIYSRQSRNLAAKQHIANIALSMVSENDTIILDSGTTCFEFAHKLVERKGITVITNDLRIALELQNTLEHVVIFLGGLGAQHLSMYNRLGGYATTSTLFRQ